MIEKLYFFNSVKYKYLFTTLVLVITFVFLITGIWYKKVSKDAEKSAVAYVSGALLTANGNFEVALKDINQLVSYAAVNNENIIDVLSKNEDRTPKAILSDNRKVENYLLSLYSFKYYLSQIMVWGINGKEYSVGITLPYNNIKSMPWYENVISSNGEKVFIPPHYVTGNPASTKIMVFSLAKPIISQGDVLGLVIADIKFDILKDIFNLNLKSQDTLLIVDNKTNAMVYKSDSGPNSLALSENEYKKISTGFTSDRGSFYVPINNKDFLVVYYKSTLTNWTTIGLIPKKQLMSGFSETRDTTLLVSLLFCAVAVAISILMSSILTKNLLKLNKAMNHIDKDNLDISIWIDSNDEVGQLYRQFNSMVLRIKVLITDIKKTEREKRSAEIRELQAQINPHFLYNTLNTIKFLAGIQGAENIVKVSESLSNLLHINMSEKSFIPVEEEIRYITSYLNIQKYKYGGRFTANISVEDGIGSFMVLKLLLQPIVENSLIHGISPLNTQGILSIRIYREDACLKMVVQDNGIGMSSEKISQILDGKINVSGIGIYTVISRIKLHFGDEYGISIISEPSMYTITEIKVPLITAEEVDKYV